MFNNKDVADAFKTSQTVIGLVRQIFSRKGDWPDDKVPEWGVYIVSLHAMLSQCGISAEHVMVIINHFQDDLYRYGVAPDNEKHAVSLIQLFDNKYVSLMDIPGQKSRSILDLTTVAVAPSIPTPLLVTSILLPKLWSLSLQALAGLSDRRDEKVPTLAPLALL